MSSFRFFPSRPSGLNVLLGVVALTLVGMLVAVVFFLANGGRWFIVATPSMGVVAPVGTLVLTEPVQVSALHVGDIISFHPPTTPAEIYTHRVIAITSGTATTPGAISTRGDINGATDPWTLHTADLIGRAATVLPGIGWLVRGVPILAIGLALVLLLTRLVPSLQWRASLRIVGVSLVVSVAAFVLRPFTGVQVLQTFVQGQHAGATVVSTGLLPIKVTAVHGNEVNLLSGQVGQLSIPTYLHDGSYRIASGLHLDIWGWIVFFLVCCTPLIITLTVGLPPKTESTQEQPA